jgi:transglutaminase-like putative cysteine protease
LWHTDGRTWRTGSAGAGPALAAQLAGSEYRYTVTLEPHGRRWLFALELPATTTSTVAARGRSDLLLEARFPVVRRISYDLVSRTSFRLTELPPREREAALALPDAAHPRARELAGELRAAAANDRDFVTRVLRRFATEPFRYTLSPPALTADPVDQFLFESRAGFCEHYAAALVVLLRAAGIPARIVTGYLGGELNPLGEYFIVRQRDAHAWAEVWYEDDGWVRVDPTSYVAPARIERGIADLLPASAGLLGTAGSNAAQALWRVVGRGLDAVTYRWDRWVVGYNPARQRQLLERIGFGTIDIGTVAAIALAAIAGLLGLLALVLLRGAATRRDPVQRAYQRFCRKLERFGLIRLPHEGPLNFALRAARAQPALRSAISRITDHYLALRYGQADDRAGFIRRVRRFPG